MQYRRTGKWGLKLPEISLGLWHNFGGTAPLERSTGTGGPRDTTSTPSSAAGGLVLAAVLLWLTDFGDTS